jgi:hypothetical protein
MLTQKIAACGALLLLAACASAPTGPSVLVLPGSNKSFEQFRFDDYECRQYASEYSGGKTAEQASADAGIRSAAAGAAIGALAGAAIGGSGNSAAAGAGLGAAGARSPAPALERRARTQCRAVMTTAICSACTPRATRSRWLLATMTGRTGRARRRRRRLHPLPARRRLRHRRTSS